MSMHTDGRPLLDPQWLAKELMPFLRYAFCDSYPYDYNYMPHIQRATDSIYHDANVFVTALRPSPLASPLSQVTPHSQEQSNRDETLEFERVYMAVMHRHNDVCADVEKLVNDVDALAKFLVEKVAKWGIFELMGQSDEGSEKWIVNEAEMIEASMEHATSPFIAPPAPAPTPNSPPTDADIDPRLLGAQAGEFTSSHLSQTLTPYEDTVYRGTYHMAEQAKLYAPPLAQSWHQPLQASSTPAYESHVGDYATPYPPPPRQYGYQTHPPVYHQPNGAPLQPQGQPFYDSYTLPVQARSLPQALLRYQSGHEEPFQGPVMQNFPNLPAYTYDPMRQPQYMGYPIPPQSLPPGQLATTDPTAQQHQYYGYQPTYHDWPPQMPPRQSLPLQIQPHSMPPPQIAPIQNPPHYLPPQMSSAQNLPPHIASSLSSTQKLNPQKGFSESRPASSLSPQHLSVGEAQQRGADIVARQVAHKKMNDLMSNHSQVQNHPPNPTHHNPTQFLALQHLQLSLSLQRLTREQIDKIEEEQKAQKRIAAAQNSMASSTSFGLPPSTLANGPTYQAPPPNMSATATGEDMLNWQPSRSFLHQTQNQGQRTRSSAACIPCKRRKVKCDLGRIEIPHDPPCERCRREGRQCVFPDRDMDVEAEEELLPPSARKKRACVSCNRRKVRCDFMSVTDAQDPPCARCRREGEECVFEGRDVEVRGEDEEMLM